MSGVIVIEKAKLSDLNSVLDIENQSFNSDLFSKRQFTYLMTKAKGKFYVLKVNGYIKAYMSLLLREKINNVRLYSIAVSQDSRGMQLATYLIEKAIEFAKRNGAKTLSLEVKTDNIPAIKLYEKNGFKIIKTKYGYYHDNSDAYIMVLKF